MFDFDADNTALRETDLSLQHHGETNDNWPPACYSFDTEHLSFTHMFDPTQMRAFAHEHLPNLAHEQRHVCDKVVGSVTSGVADMFMISAPAGTGTVKRTRKVLFAPMSGLPVSWCYVSPVQV